jgi:uncharacterized phage-associated protein
MKKVISRKKTSIFDVAICFLKIVDRDSGSTITPLKLQKLLYYAQGWYLAINDRELFKEDFEAWAHGPANPAIYDKYKKYGRDSIDYPNENSKIANGVLDFLYTIWSTYGIYDGKYLENLTHSETPWIEARKKGNCQDGDSCSEIITKESMKAFFKRKMTENENS